MHLLEEEGITIETSKGPVKLYFGLAIVIGDNLGLHGLLGFHESFKANYFCRFCIIHKDNICQVFEECIHDRRTVENCNLHIKMNCPKLTGVKGLCVLHQLLSFHATRNSAVDFMHDSLEGVCRYDLALILYYYIYNLRIFTLEELNTHLRSSNYGEDNRVIEILESHLVK